MKKISRISFPEKREYFGIRKLKVGVASVAIATTLFWGAGLTNVSADQISSQTPASSLFDQPQQQRVNSTPNNIEKTVIKYVDKPSRSVSRITIFYSDGMFETFVPEKK